MGSVLGSFGVFQGNIGSAAPFIPVEDWEGRKISILPSWNFFDGGPSPDLCDIFSGPMSIIWAIFSKIRDDVFSKSAHLCIVIFGLFCPFWANYGTSKHLKHQKHTNCNPLGANRPTKYMKMVPNSHLKIWSSRDLKSHPGAKNAHQMTGEG